MNCPRCDKPIDEHEAGRETDTCVAEVVMGWKRHDDRSDSLAGWMRWHNEQARYVWAGYSAIDLRIERDPDTDDEYCIPLGGWPTFLPSTDIAAAWVVVEKLDATFRLVVGMGAECLAQVGQRDWVTAPTAPLVICRTALQSTPNT